MTFTTKMLQGMAMDIELAAYQSAFKRKECHLAIIIPFPRESLNRFSFPIWPSKLY
jgi:hypothetical protein